MRKSAALLLLAISSASARAFEWDDGRGAFPFRPVTTRQYEQAKDLDHMNRFRAGSGDYGAAVAKRILARTPGAARAGPGEATARFHIGPSGRVDAIHVVSSTRPAHARILRAIFSSLRAPPPPGGSYENEQTIRFH
ncbi:hypothetical protein [Methylocystis sp. S23]|jgi:hypothetical protein